MKELTVNSSIDELKAGLGDMTLTLEEAQAIGLIIYTKLHTTKTELNEFCDKCYITKKPSWSKQTPQEYKLELKKKVVLLGKLNKMFYPYTKYDW